MILPLSCPGLGELDPDLSDRHLTCGTVAKRWQLLPVERWD